MPTDPLACLKHQSYFAGSAFTNGKCSRCGDGILHPNTFTPRWCKKCAKEKHICQYCGEKLWEPEKIDENTFKKEHLGEIPEKENND